MARLHRVDWAKAFGRLAASHVRLTWARAGVLAIAAFGIWPAVSLGAETLAANAARTAKPAPMALLEHYLQWGHFDSLWLASDAALKNLTPRDQAAPSNEADPDTLARLHLMRGAAWVAAAADTLPEARAGVLTLARQDFLQAACLKTEARLDSFYVPATMVHLSDSLRNLVLAQPSSCAGWAMPTMSPAADLQPANRPAATATGASTPARAWRTWGFALSGLAGASLVASAYAHGQAESALARQRDAGLDGRRDAYDRYGRERQAAQTLRNASLGTALLFGLAGGYALKVYWAW